MRSLHSKSGRTILSGDSPALVAFGQASGTFAPVLVLDVVARIALSLVVVHAISLALIENRMPGPYLDHSEATPVGFSSARTGPFLSGTGPGLREGGYPSITSHSLGQYSACVFLVTRAGNIHRPAIGGACTELVRPMPR